MGKQHLVSLWNPMYGPNVMKLHLDLLLEKVRRHRAGQFDAESVFVWRDKVWSSSRRGPLPHCVDLHRIDT